MSLAVAAESVVVRPATSSDADFIFDSWLNSFRANNSEAKEVPAAVFFSMHRLHLDALLRKSAVLVACSPEAPSIIMGWVAFGETASQGVLHYLYVKHLYRGFDITAVLTSALPKRCRWYTHRTPKLQRVAKALGLTFNPYLAGVLP